MRINRKKFLSLIMEAIILAGGLGSRLKSVIKNIPKPMAPISGFPFLEIILKNLNKKGFKRIIISTFYKSEVIENYFADRYQNMEIIYTKEKDTLGTGGAINFSLNFVSNNVDHIYVLNGDTFLDLDIKVIEEKWLKYKEPILVGVEVDACERYGKFLIKRFD